MSKASKHRECPAVKRAITSQECGENRNIGYSCTADCAFNPFSPANYAALLELEEKLDHATSDALKLDRETRHRIERDFERIDFERLEPVVSLLCTETFFRKGADGQTWAARWMASGCGNWKNDLRALFARKAKLRARLVQVLEVRSEAECLVHDLLEPELSRFVLRDRVIASMACRFDTFLTPTFDLPFFSRVIACGVPVYGQGLPALETLLEIARHLGAPEDREALNAWLVEHLADIADALSDTARARHEAMLQSADLRFGKAVYALTAPFAECREALDRVPEVAKDPLRGSERKEGFTEARAWLEKPPGQSAGSEQVVGRILMGPSHWRVEAMGEERTNAIRTRLESTLGTRVTFEGQRLDDIGRPSAPSQPSRLVPPRLLENLQKLQIGSSRIAVSRAIRAGEGLQESAMRVMDEEFLHMQVPALDGKTPGEAAADAALRPKLIELLKQRINGTDRKNLEEGINYSPQWMLEKLGVAEFFGPPPPPRARPPRKEYARDEQFEADEEEELMDPPPIPPGRHLAPELLHEVSVEEMGKRFAEATATLKSGKEMLAEMTAAGCIWFESALTCLELEPESAEMRALARTLLPVWFAMIPVGGWVWTTSPEIVEEVFEDNLAELEKVFEGAREGKIEMFELSSQPQILRAGMELLKTNLQEEKVDDPKSLGRAVAFLAAAIDELSDALSEQNRDKE